MKTTVLLDHEPVADGGWMVHALLRVEGQAPPDRDRVPLNLSLVLDRSGSMLVSNKLAAAKSAAQSMVLSHSTTVASGSSRCSSGRSVSRCRATRQVTRASIAQDYARLP